VVKPRAGAGPFYGWYIVAALFFATFIAFGARQGFGVFVEAWEKDFGAKTATVTAAAAVGWVVNGLSQPYFGRLTDRLGGRKVFIVGMALMGISTIAVAASPNPYVLMATYGFVLSFASGATSFTPAGSLVARWFVRRRGRAMSMLTVGGSLSGMVMVPFLAYLLDLTSWQTVWVVLGVLTLGLGMPVLLLVLRSDPESMGLEPDGERTEGAAAGKRSRSNAIGPLDAARWQESFRSPPMWQLSMAYAVCGITTASISVHYVRWASSEGITPGTAALAFGVLSGINAAGVLSIGAISDRLQRKTLLGLVYFVRGLAFLSLIFLPGHAALWTFAVVGGMSWLATVPLTTSLAADVYGVKHLGTLAGLINMSHQLAGGAAVLIFGLVFDAWDTYNPAFAGGAALLLAASVISLSIRERRYSARYSPVVREPAPVAAGEPAAAGS
jgi:MFS family permease